MYVRADPVHVQWVLVFNTVSLYGAVLLEVPLHHYFKSISETVTVTVAVILCDDKWFICTTIDNSSWQKISCLNQWVCDNHTAQWQHSWSESLCQNDLNSGQLLENISCANKSHLHIPTTTPTHSNSRFSSVRHEMSGWFCLHTTISYWVCANTGARLWLSSELESGVWTSKNKAGNAY